MKWKNWFAAEIIKKCDVGQCFFEAWMEVCLTSKIYDSWPCSFIISPIFTIWSIANLHLLIPTKKSIYYNHMSSLVVLWGIVMSHHRKIPRIFLWWQQTWLSMVATISWATRHSGSCCCTHGCSPSPALLACLLKGVAITMVGPASAVLTMPT